MKTVISIDHGNRQIKTSTGHAFTSGYVESGHLLTMDSDVLQFNKKEYALSDKCIIQKNDKSVDDDYFILTLFAIGKELMAQPRQAANTPYEVELLTGLPPLHYKSLRKKFKTYFTERDDIIKIRLNNRHMAITIKNAYVYPQAYAAALTVYDEIKEYPSVNIIDIGGYTADCLYLEKMQMNMNICTSLYKGVNTLFQKINEQARATGGQDIRESILENILRNDKKTIDNYSKSRVDLVQNQARKFAAEILSEASHTGQDLVEDMTVFVGGGAMLLRTYLEECNIAKRMIFVNDLFANAKGYEIIHCMKKK